MTGDIQNTNKITIGLESIIFLASLVVVILNVVGKISIPWVTPISWILFLLTIGYFIIRLIQGVNN
jgi:hypothetical protein